jgi:hypothetical protein
MINVRMLACKVPVSLVKYQLVLSDLIELEFLEQVFKWSLNIKFQENSYQWKPGCWVQTDRHEANSRFSQRVVYHLGYLPISLKYKMKYVLCDTFC